jgi:hypothetical protein
LYGLEKTFLEKFPGGSGKDEPDTFPGWDGSRQQTQVDLCLSFLAALPDVEADFERELFERVAFVNDVSFAHEFELIVRGFAVLMQAEISHMLIQPGGENLMPGITQPEVIIEGVLQPLVQGSAGALPQVTMEEYAGLGEE